MPKIIGLARITVNPVWANLWRVKALSGTAWAAWLRELESVGLEPAERSGWAIGNVVPIKFRLGYELVKFRRKQLAEAGVTLSAPTRVARYCSLDSAGHATERSLSKRHAERQRQATFTVSEYHNELWFDG